jgi:hypothetical protein
MFFSTAVLAALAGVAAAKDGRTFAVLHHYGKGPLMTGRVDPVVFPGQISSHVHTVMGGSNFGFDATGATLRESNCTTAKIKNDKSAYWFPALYFEDPKDGHFEPVEMFYMNVYYFFEGTNDEIKAFPTGLMMVAGDAMARTAPNTDGTSNLDPSEGPVNPLQWTCPRKNFDPPSWPAGSDGSKAGIQDPNNKGSGIGFPFAECDGYASPLRMDLHFPSCYNPAADLKDYKTNTAYPSSAGNGKQDCPKGWIHMPHLFYEVYWNTPKFSGRWTPNQGSQPFVLANGDRTGYSGHGDFIAGWDEPTLQKIIDTCDAGDSGMTNCPEIIGGINDDSTSCNINSPVDEQIDGTLTALPGSNPVAGWGLGSAPAAAQSGAASAAPVKSSTSSAAPVQASSTKAASVSSADPIDVKASASSTSVKVVTGTKTVIAGASTTSTEPAVLPTDTGNSAAPGDSTSTQWETVTEWQTTTVYDSSAAPTATAVPTASNGTDSSSASIAGYTYAGCFKDTRDRVLTGDIRPNLGSVSNTNCVAHCKSKGYNLAGTEYGGQCYCGDSLTGSSQLDESECDLACEDDKAQVCGGGWALSLYSANGKVDKRDVKKERHLHSHVHARRVGRS